MNIDREKEVYSQIEGLRSQIECLREENAHFKHRMNLYWDSYQSALKTIIDLRNNRPHLRVGDGKISVRMVGRKQMGVIE